MWRALILPLWLLAWERAAAEELPPPPQLTTPPSWAPYAVVPGPSPEQINALEQYGRRDKRIGAILMGTGAGIALAGTALWIAGAWDDRCHYWTEDRCGSSALSIAGATTTILGTASIVAGVVVFVSGASDVDRARRMRRYFWGPVSLQPTVNRSAGGVQLRIEH